MKLGIYSSPGPKTCGGMEGSYQHEDQDATMFAAWGIDYLKYDLCSYIPILEKFAHGDPVKSRQREIEIYEKMHKALVATGRPIVFSFCQYGWDASWEWAPKAGGNLWRTTADIKDNYDRMSVIGFSQAGLSRYAGPGHWNDPDMLEIGNGGMTKDEYQTHMTLWAMLAAPLIAGNDVTQMSAETKAILLNKEIIAIDQDPLGQAGDRIRSVGPLEYWRRSLKGGDVAIAIFNRGDNQLLVRTDDKDLHPFGSNGTVQDIWKGETKDIKDLATTIVIPKHGVVVLRFSPARMHTN